ASPMGQGPLLAMPVLSARKTGNVVQLKKDVSQKDKEIEHWKENFEREKNQRQEKERELAELKNKKSKLQNSNLKPPADPPTREPNVLEELQRLAKAARAPAFDKTNAAGKLATLDVQAHQAIAELDKVYAELAPKTIPYY